MSIDDSPLTTNARRVLKLISGVLQERNAPCSLEAHFRPIVIGLTGLQGSGKSTWSTKIVSLLHEEHGLNAITVSLDDFYKTHDGLVALRESDLENKLFRTRGQPGTHDEELAESFFAVANIQGTDGSEKVLEVPSFDKSRFNGEGDRAPKDAWPHVKLPVDVIVFEGWCVGFSPIPEVDIEEKHEQALRRRCNKTLESQFPTETLADHKLNHLLELNENLRKYDRAFMGPQDFDCLVHLDTNNLENVYVWRMDQENEMRKKTGGLGMADGAVVEFVKGYMPAYELYLESLRSGFFKEQGDEAKKVQVRVCLDKGRKVVECATI